MTAHITFRDRSEIADHLSEDTVWELLTSPRQFPEIHDACARRLANSKEPGYRLAAREHLRMNRRSGTQAADFIEADADAARPDPDADFGDVPAVSLSGWLAGLHPATWAIAFICAAGGASIAWRMFA